MPTGYWGQGKTFSKKLHKWVDVEKEQAFNYEEVNLESIGFLISFFRYYPDYFADIFRNQNADYKLELPQRLMLRIMARYRNVFITGVRGITKTYTLILGKMIEGTLYPGVICRYSAPNQKQAATIAAQAFHQIEKDYPIIAAMWEIRNDRADMFRITTPYGSEFTMYAPRGSNANQSCAEEIAQEGEDGFDLEKYEREVLPTVRLIRKVNQKKDPFYINLKHSSITNASSKINQAFTKHRYSALKDMIFGKNNDGYLLEMSWITALITNIRDISYIKDQKNKLTAENWLREMCARYTGSGQNPILTDEILAKSRKLNIMEDRHCGDKKVIYVLSHDVSYETGQKNAKCADTVTKLIKYDNIEKRDKYRKQVVWVDSYPPPKTEALQAQKIKDLWLRFSIEGANPTYIVIDARAVGKTVVQELMKPTADGTPVLCCYKNMEYQEIAQPDSLPLIYPLKASNGGIDNESEMLRYARKEFEVGNVELLTSNILNGINQYKLKHNIKDDYADIKISLPYKKTDELCQEINNLQTDVSGTSLKEKRKSSAIQRDIWSSLKYNLHFCAILESKLVSEEYKAQSSWNHTIKGYKELNSSTNLKYNNVNNLLNFRKIR